MKYKATILVTLFLLICLNVFSQKETPISKAINIASKQRMLAQRMAKDKLFILVNKNSIEAKQELKTTLKSFEEGLVFLKEFAPTNAIKYKINLQEVAYATYKKQISKRNEKSMIEIFDLNTMFLTTCEDIFISLIDYNEAEENNKKQNEKNLNEHIIKAIKSTGKLCYLTQRLALYYTMNEYGVKQVPSTEIETIKNTIDNNLNYLSVLEFNTFEIDDSLSQVLFSWNRLKSKLRKRELSKIYPLDLFKLCNQVLTDIDVANRMYSTLSL